MNLHRTTGQPDWTTVEPAERNAWQRLAAATHGLLTPGNIITLAGLIIVLAALLALMRGHGWLAVIGLAVGRLLDLADGLAAQATSTKSPLGEAMDATVDKIGTGLTLFAAGASGAVPWLTVGLLALPHLIIAVIVIGARARGRQFHPSRTGKFSMAAAWVALLGLIALKAAALNPASIIGLLVYGLAIASIIMGLTAAGGYYRQTK